MTKEQREALVLLDNLRSTGLGDEDAITQEEFILLASFVVDWHEPAPRAEIVNDGYIHAPLGDFRLSVDKEDGVPDDEEFLAMEEKEKEEIKRALELHDYKLGRAAEALGVSERTLRRRIKEYGITLNPEP